eukprot:g8471.t1
MNTRKRIKTPAPSAAILKNAGRKRNIPMKRVERETTMTLKHKLKKSTSATSLALTDALNKLQELELQATENRFKVNQVHENVEKTLSEYGKLRVMGLDDEELNLAKINLRGRVESMFDTFDYNHVKEQKTLETIQEGLSNTVKNDQQNDGGGEGGIENQK